MDRKNGVGDLAVLFCPKNYEQIMYNMHKKLI